MLKIGDGCATHMADMATLWPGGDSGHRQKE